jgi:hypothetical protein
MAQLMNVIDAIRKHVGQYDASYVAIIVTHSGAPTGKEQKQLQDRMADKDVKLRFKTGVKSGARVNIRQFLVD